MMQQTWSGLPDDEGTSQRSQRELLVKTVAHRPAHDPSRVQVEDHRQVQPALPRPDVGDVAPPLPIRPSRREVLVEVVGRDREGVAAVRRASEAGRVRQ